MLEKTKTKHNKKRNTAFLYEVIIREITKAVLEKRESDKDMLIKVCKAFFSSNKILKKELDLYDSLGRTFNLNEDIAKRVLAEAKYQYDMLDKNKIFNEQTKLINILNKLSDGKIFSTFVPDYKNLATISQIFNNSIPVKEKILLENTVLSKMSTNPEEKDKDKLEALDSLAYKLFIKKFNEQYGDNLLAEQKELITKYVMSFYDNGIEFKLFINEELARLKETLDGELKSKFLNEDQDLKNKTQNVLNKIVSYKQKELDNTCIQEILKIQHLVSEFKKEESHNG